MANISGEIYFVNFSPFQTCWIESGWLGTGLCWERGEALLSITVGVFKELWIQIGEVIFLYCTMEYVQSVEAWLWQICLGLYLTHFVSAVSPVLQG